ncbi:MAG: glycosyltransferase [Anaerolineae bacterium]
MPSLSLLSRIQEWLRSFPSWAPIVVVPVFNAYEDVLECVESLLKNTSPDVPILILDDASTDVRIPQALEKYSDGGHCFYVRKSENTGFVSTVNLAFAASTPRDVIVLNSDVIVPPGWLERLRAAAYFRSNIATATPLTNHGTVVSVPYRNRPVALGEGEVDVEEIDARIRAISLKLYPIIPTAVGHCVYFKRAVLDLVGYFDESFSPGYGEEVDFSQRAVLLGFSHVLADDLFVYHKGSRSFGAEGEKAGQHVRSAHENLIRKRYPWYTEWTTRVATDRDSPLAYAIEQARDAILGYRIAIDATCIGGPVTGTQLHTLGLIRALALSKKPDVHLSIIVHDHIEKPSLLGVDSLVDEVVTLSELRNLSEPRFSLVHRPFQLHRQEELAFLRTIAHRMVVSILDFIAFSSVGYALNYADWERYRVLIQMACNVADGVIFNSDDVRQDAVHQGILIEQERVSVIPPGTDHQWTDALDNMDEAKIPSPPFILVLGTNFRHKNRLYAMKVMRVLIHKYGWEGKLVFAGPKVSWGGAEVEEEIFLKQNPDVRAQICDLGLVTEQEKQWLLKHSSLVFFPSTYEGFGLVPFEAAAAGTPALTARTTALSEVLGDAVIYLDSFDPEQGADLVWRFLTDPEISARQVEAIKARATLFTWAATAQKAWEFYHRVLSMPPRPNRAVVWRLATGGKPDLIPIGGPLYKRVGMRVKRAMGITLAEWLGLFKETVQFFRFHVNRLFRRS